MKPTSRVGNIVSNKVELCVGGTGGSFLLSAFIHTAKLLQKTGPNWCLCSKPEWAVYTCNIDGGTKILLVPG